MLLAKFIRMDNHDNVAIALADLKTGEGIEINAITSISSIILKNDTPFGHKFAIKQIEMGGQVLKNGEVIGIASKTIMAGEHVHIHNLSGIRSNPAST